MMILSLRSASLGVLLLGVMLSTVPAVAQTPRRVTRTPTQLLDALVRDHQTPVKPLTPAGIDLTHVLTYPRDYPAADLEKLLRGLEQLALTGESPRLRADAALSLSIPGSYRAVRPIQGTMARLGRIYRRTADAHVRAAVVSGMAGMANPAEHREALAFLERIAVQENADFPGSASKALNMLMFMGEPGRAVLKRLHDTGVVRDPEARNVLAASARQGYRVR
jgi:hypothetical protein